MEHRAALANACQAIDRAKEKRLKECVLRCGTHSSQEAAVRFLRAEGYTVESSDRAGRLFLNVSWK